MGDTVTGIEVEPVGHDGNAFSVLGESILAMRRAGVDEEIVAA